MDKVFGAIANAAADVDTIYGLIAVIVLIGTYGLFIYFVQRPRALYERLEALPEDDRIEAIRILNPFPKEGISANDWLQSQRQKTQVVLVAIVCVSLVCIFVAGKSGYRAWGGGGQTFAKTIPRTPPWGPSDPAILYVITIPTEALVRVLSIGPPYESGISIQPGPHRIEVSAKGYQTQILARTLESGDNTLNVRLKSIRNPVHSPDPEKQRDAARRMYENGVKGASSLKALEEELELGLAINDPGSMKRDALAWMCKAISQSGVKQYLPILERAAKEGQGVMLRYHCRRAVKTLTTQ